MKTTHFFEYYVHLTCGLIRDINSTPLNLPVGGFYSLEIARSFANSICDGRNFVATYDNEGKLVEIQRVAV